MKPRYTPKPCPTAAQIRNFVEGFKPGVDVPTGAQRRALQDKLDRAAEGVDLGFVRPDEMGQPGAWSRRFGSSETPRAPVSKPEGEKL
jgi:hypothetical protein